MKRYIRAAFDPSMPDWMRKTLKGHLGEKLANKYGIALDKVKVLDYDPGTADVLTIYKLRTDYGTRVYIPGVNDDETAAINKRYRKLGSIAKSKLPVMSVDIGFIDLTNPEFKLIRRERYEDPRYIYDRGTSNGYYAGQYKMYKSSPDEPDVWSETGKRGRHEVGYRDKSGYAVPTPESQIARYYSMFPEKVTDKVDAVYARLCEVRDKLFSFDFSAPAQRGYSDASYRNATSYFASAVEEYRNVLHQLKGANFGELSDLRYWGYTPKDFSRDLDNIKSSLDSAEKYFEAALRN
jgi:hypothetical protein